MLKGILPCEAQTKEGNISWDQAKAVLDQLLCQLPPFRRALLVPPDLTRCYSYGGKIANYLYHALNLKSVGGQAVMIMPAIGTHSPMTREQQIRFFGEDIPESAFLCHDWRKDLAYVGTVPAAFVRDVTEGRWDHEIPVEIDSRLTDGSFDLILSIGQVVPHEVVGMANYTKNILVGLGGRKVINESHMAGAVCNLETIMGNIDTPVRKIFDYAEEHFLTSIPLVYVLTVTTEEKGEAALHGIFCGSERDSYVAAAKLAQHWNVTYVPKKAKKVVAYLEPEEFSTTWVGNKAIYRTRMMIEDGGELLILAPGIKRFGENDEVDCLIRQYGYRGTKATMALVEKGVFSDAAMVPAHMSHGSSEGRFTITYALKSQNMSQDEIQAVGYEYMELEEVLHKYSPGNMKEGFQIMPDGEEIYFVKTPAVGLWKVW